MARLNCRMLRLQGVEQPAWWLRRGTKVIGKALFMGRPPNNVATGGKRVDALSDLLAVNGSMEHLADPGPGASYARLRFVTFRFSCFY